MDAEHPLRSQLVDEAGHGPPGADRDDDGRQIVGLGEEFTPALDIAARADHAGTAEGNHGRGSAPQPQLRGHLLGGEVKSLFVVATGPYDGGAEEPVECEIARGRRSGCAREYEDHIEPQPGAGGRGQPRVVALRRTGRHQDGGAVGQRRTAEPLKLAHLVSAAAEAGEVVAFDPQVVHTEPERTRQPWHGLERRRPGAERCSLRGTAVVRGHRHHSCPPGRRRGSRPYCREAAGWCAMTLPGRVRRRRCSRRAPPRNAPPRPRARRPARP